MTQDYPLEELSPRAFEQLTVALAMQVLGHGVRSFGSGPDGGREATYTGPVEWSATTGFGRDSWDGYVVIQSKQRERLGTPEQHTAWLKRQITNELGSWMASDSKRGAFPSYLLFVTNVNLSSSPGSGGIDVINKHAETLRTTAARDGSRRDSPAARGLKEIKVWHRDDLNALLSVYAQIRSSFKGLLTVGDLLQSLSPFNGVLDPERFEPVMRSHSLRCLKTERWVKFQEAGGSDRESVDDIIIDLKATDESRASITVLEEVVTRSNQVMRRTASQPPRHIVLTGQPGSGKSTITRFITQLFRTSFIRQEKSIPSTCTQVVEGTTAAIERLGLDAPRGKRWPIRVNLAHYADVRGPGGDKSLIRWLSEQVEQGSELDFMPSTLKQWIKHWPSLIVLDGLDEVTSPEVRPEILDEIQSFVEECDADDADVLILVTTRPTGYNEKLIPGRFDQIDLQYLDTETAMDYGRRITTRRLAEDSERNQVLEKFEAYAEESAALRLMKTPLQVLIITLILERFGSLPADRFQLFSRYFDTIYDREAAKATSLKPLLQDHRRVITDLHEAVGLEYRS